MIFLDYVKILNYKLLLNTNLVFSFPKFENFNSITLLNILEKEWNRQSTGNINI